MRVPGSQRTDRTLSRFDVDTHTPEGWSTLPLRIESEVAKSLLMGTEDRVQCRWVADPDSALPQPVALVYMPYCARGAVAAGDLELWTDATGLDDLEDRWATFPDRWTY